MTYLAISQVTSTPLHLLILCGSGLIAGLSLGWRMVDTQCAIKILGLVPAGLGIATCLEVAMRATDGTPWWIIDVGAAWLCIVVVGLATIFAVTRVHLAQ